MITEIKIRTERQTRARMGRMFMKNNIFILFYRECTCVNYLTYRQNNYYLNMEYHSLLLEFVCIFVSVIRRCLIVLDSMGDHSNSLAN